MLQVRSPASQIKTANFAHTAATSSKTPLVINSHVLIPVGDAAANAVNGFYYEAEISDADKATVALAVGDAVYWDAANSKVTNTDNTGANAKIGYALEAAASGDAVTGLIAFNSFA